MVCVFVSPDEVAPSGRWSEGGIHFPLSAPPQAKGSRSLQIRGCRTVSHAPAHYQLPTGPRVLDLAGVHISPTCVCVFHHIQQCLLLVIL